MSIEGTSGVTEVWLVLFVTAPTRLGCQTTTYGESTGEVIAVVFVTLVFVPLEVVTLLTDDETAPFSGFVVFTIV